MKIYLAEMKGISRYDFVNQQHLDKIRCPHLGAPPPGLSRFECPPGLSGYLLVVLINCRIHSVKYA